MNKYAEVIVDIANSNVDRVFDYIVPEDMRVSAGTRVSVPFSGRELEGCVLDVKENTNCPPEKLKSILRTLDAEPLITEEQIKLAKYIKHEYRTTMAFALRFMYPAHMRGGRVKDKTVRMISLSPDADVEEEIRLCHTKDGRVKAKNRLAVLNALKDGERAAAEFDSASVCALIKKGTITETRRRTLRTPYKGLAAAQGDAIELTDSQKNAIEVITRRVREHKKKTILLHGVTGSGKTEVYIQSVKNTLEAGRTAIILVPEISLTPQLYAVFHARFGDNIAVFHSGLSAGEKYDEYMRVKGERRGL